MSEYSGIKILIKRELLKYFNNLSRIFGSLGTPIFFLVFLGLGLGPSLGSISGIPYIDYIAPGIIVLNLLFSSVFNGVTIIIERQFGFLKEILVAPISRTSIVLGKTIGGGLTAVIQAAILLLLFPLLGVSYTFPNILLTLPVALIFASSMVNIGVAIASKMRDTQGFQLVVNFLIFPLFFLSGTFYPITNLPNFLQVIVKFNPVAYATDLLRYTMTGAHVNSIPLDAIVLVGFFLLTLVVAAKLFKDQV